ncbi:MAG: hypothetical protein MK207_11895 [Saprospiraceae bacterium]|nr:hypothetical protein [Saprospiraceae bacterium]
MKFIKVKALLTLFILTTSFGAATSQEKHQIKLNKSSFGEYPAVIIDLKNNSLTKINNDFRSMKEIKGDLWIEPRDPEINGIQSSLERVKHVGKSVLLKLIEADLTDQQIQELELTTFQTRIKSESIKSGIVFAVIASDGSLYKVTITDFEQQKEALKLDYYLIE